MPPRGNPRGLKSTRGASNSTRNSGNGRDHNYTKPQKGNFQVLVDESVSDSEGDAAETALCFGCKKTLEKSENGVCCNFCEHWYCLSCSKLKKVVYQALKDSPDNLMWFCEHCLTAFPGVKKVMINMGNLEDRVDKLETRVDKLEEAPKEADRNVESVVRNEIREIQDVEARKLNLMCFNLPESNLENMEDRKLEDMRCLQEIVNQDMQLVDREIQVSNPVRLGKKDEKQDVQKRPLRFSVDSFEMKRQILQGNVKLKQHHDENKKKIFITPDLTKKQRDESFKLREELRYRKNVLHEQNIKISRGKIVTVGRQDGETSLGESNNDGTNQNVFHSRTFTNSADERKRRESPLDRGESPPPRLFRTN